MKTIRFDILGCFIFLTLIGIILLFENFNKENNLITKNVTLATCPKYDFFSGTKGSRYWIELNFIEFPEKLEISGFDYAYLNHPLFVEQLKKDSIISISYSDGWIRQLSKNGKTFMDPVASKNSSVQNMKAALLIFIVGFIFCLIIALVSYIIPEKHFLILMKHFGKIIFSLLIITMFIISLVFKSSDIDAGWTKYPVKNRRGVVC